MRKTTNYACKQNLKCQENFYQGQGAVATQQCTVNYGKDGYHLSSDEESVTKELLFCIQTFVESFGTLSEKCAFEVCLNGYDEPCKLSSECYQEYNEPCNSTFECGTSGKLVENKALQCNGIIECVDFSDESKECLNAGYISKD